MSGIQDPIQVSHMYRYAVVGALSAGGAAYVLGLPNPLMYAGVGAVALPLAQNLQAGASGLEAKALSDPVVTAAAAGAVAYANGADPLMPAVVAGVAEMAAYEVVKRFL